MSATASQSRDRRPDDRRPEAHRVSARRRDSHRTNRVTDGVAGQSLHITPNAVVATRGVWNFRTVKRFAQWLTDGATDRPHLRF